MVMVLDSVMCWAGGFLYVRMLTKGIIRKEVRVRFNFSVRLILLFQMPLGEAHNPGIT